MNDIDIHDYSDIISLEHHVSDKHPPMPMEDRAAQFGAFSALAGHDDAISETARLTEPWEDMSEYVIEVLNGKLQYINDNLPLEKEVSIKYFKSDTMKDGGEYLVHTGKIRRIDEVNRWIMFDDGETIDINSVFDIEIDM